MRPTAAIDRAWRERDAEGVEKALRDYATEEEQVICLILANARAETIDFILEPWAEQITLDASAKVLVFICEPKLQPWGWEHRTHIEMEEDCIVLFAPTGAMAYILDAADTPSPSPRHLVALKATSGVEHEEIPTEQ